MGCLILDGIVAAGLTHRRDNLVDLTLEQRIFVGAGEHELAFGEQSETRQHRLDAKEAAIEFRLARDAGETGCHPALLYLPSRLFRGSASDLGRRKVALSDSERSLVPLSVRRRIARRLGQLGQTATRIYTPLAFLRQTSLNFADRGVRQIAGRYSVRTRLVFCLKLSQPGPQLTLTRDQLVEICGNG